MFLQQGKLLWMLSLILYGPTKQVAEKPGFRVSPAQMLRKNALYEGHGFSRAVEESN
jgi:hypothetical protein